MTSAISGATNTLSTAHAAPAQALKPVAKPASDKTSQPAASPTPRGDTAQLSSAAQAALAALKEATETPAQTAKEAGAGDVQAKRLVARQAASKAAE